MARIDIPRLRKEKKMTQSDLAKRLKLSQGFLSSVESGRNPFPDERVDDLQSVFPDADLGDYQLPEPQRATTTMGSDNYQPDIRINDPQMVRTVAAIASREVREEDVMVQESNTNAKEYQDRLISLSDKLEEARRENYELRIELLRLKELLMKNNIDYEK